MNTISKDAQAEQVADWLNGRAKVVNLSASPHDDSSEREAAEMDLFYGFLPLRRKANLHIDGDLND